MPDLAKKHRQKIAILIMLAMIGVVAALGGYSSDKLAAVDRATAHRSESEQLKDAISNYDGARTQAENIARLRERANLQEFYGCMDAQYRGMRLSSDEACIARAERKPD